MNSIFRIVFTLWGFLVFFAFMFLLLPFFIYSFFRGRVKGGNFLYEICRFWADSFYLLTGIRHENIYEYTPDKNRQYIFISNHISYLDIPEIMEVTRGFNVRILAKSEMGRLPIFGFIYRQGTVMVDRNDAEARKKSVYELKYFLKKKISVFICPEGTFNKSNAPLKSFYDGAFRIALETKTPLLPVLLLDTYDRLCYKNIFSLNAGRSRAVFLPPIEVEAFARTDVRELKQVAFEKMETALKRYHPSWTGPNGD